MGFFDTLVNILQSLLCGGKPQVDDGRPQDGYAQGGPVYQAPQQQQPQYQQQPQINQYQQQPQPSYQYPPQPPQQPVHVPQPPAQKPHQKRFDDNQVNHENPHYKDLRSRAHEEGDAMARCFRESQEAYKSGDGARAKQLSNEGKQHQAEMDRLNKEAGDWIFRENNLDSAPDELDLHGLYVKEAIDKTDQAIVQAQSRGASQIRLIVGKGLHSQGSVAKLKPAIEQLMAKHQLQAALDPQNAGVLIVSLNRTGGGMNPDEITKRLENDQCSIM